MKTLAFQISPDLWFRLKQILHDAMRDNLDNPEPTMRALCTSLLEDSLKHRKPAEIKQLMLGQQIKRGRPVLQPMNKQYEESKEETTKQRMKRLHGWDIK